MINEDPSIQENLLQLSIQLGHPLDQPFVDRLYRYETLSGLWRFPQGNAMRTIITGIFRSDS